MYVRLRGGQIGFWFRLFGFQPLWVWRIQPKRFQICNLNQTEFNSVQFIIPKVQSNSPPPTPKIK